MRRRELIGLVGVSSVWPLFAYALQGHMRRIGILGACPSNRIFLDDCQVS
jgi:hypothetical protein